MAYQSEIEKLTARWKENPDQYFAPLADACRKSGDIDYALEVVRAGLERRPTYLSAHIVLGRCLLDQKNDAEAAKVFEHVLELDAENIIALRYLGEIAERQKDFAGAQRWVKRLLEVDPMNDDAVESLKRLEAAAPAPAPEPAPAAPSAPKPAVSESISGFETTSMEPASAPAASESNDLVLEQSSSPFESSEAAPGPGLELESTEMTFDAAPAKAAPAAEASASSPSHEPAMLMFDEKPLSLEESPPEAAASPANVDEADAPSQDLPLIMPDDVTPPEPPRVSRVSTQRPAPAPAPSVDGIEPEPVITETMAEVYLKQGLVGEAREVYRRLVERRPGDRALREKLASLEQRSSPPRGVPQVPAAPKQRFTATETGGVSARSLFGKVLAARPGAAPARALTPQQQVESAGSAMDAAFANEPVQGQGEPTRPTSDELSLAAVFGEEAAPAPKPATPQSAPPPGFSFDEFFGGKRPAEGAPPPDQAASDGETAPPDDFVSWLKGLKS